MNDDGLKTIGALQAEVAALEAEALRIENAVLRKRIAIEEIVRSKLATAFPAKEASAPAPVVAVNGAPSIGTMIDTLLAEGAPMDVATLRRLCIERWPSQAKKVRQGIWSAFRYRALMKGVGVGTYRNGANRALTSANGEAPLQHDRTNPVGNPERA